MKIDQQTINQLKSQFGNEIYSVKIGKDEYAFRALTSKEYKTFSQLGLASADLEDLIVMNAVVYPQPLNIDKVKPGTISAIADEILEMSGFTSIDMAVHFLDEARQEASTAIEMMKAFIISTMPTYDYDELDNYTLRRLSKLVAVSEVILEIQTGVAQGQEIKMTLMNPEEEQVQQKKTHDFTIDDIEKANKALKSDVGFDKFDAPPTDPIAQKLWSALQ